ncbi:hypothetical protein AC630_03870 [Bradyrhizobium sp. AS23.2]|nr:hypothetical protein AC630_03870 [Bradyrhizobium sp. AS23.2]
MAHTNRSHQRTFTLNIFRMNAQELIGITRRVNDPDEGIRLMAVANREAGSQTHREVTRRVHNFVAAALTLVEHTRIFMREHYSETPMLERYQARVDADFKNQPLARFVQDLRNYILHNGLPNSEMYMNFQSNADQPGTGTLETGIHIRSAPLLEWRNWSAPARIFIEGCGEFVDIGTIAESYTGNVLSFHGWLQRCLDQIHAADLDELRTLEGALNQLDAAAKPAPSVPPETSVSSGDGADGPEQDFSFAPDRAASLDAAANALLHKVRKIQLEAQHGDGFPSERPPSATLTDHEMLSVPLVWATDVESRRAFVFIYKDGAQFGLDEEAFAEMQALTESVLRSDWASRTLSRRFLEKTAIKWLQESYEVENTKSLAETIAKEGRKAVRSLELWAPIANLEVQNSFPVGPAEVATITRAMIEKLESEALGSAPQQRDSIVGLFNKLRQNMQGLAAVVFKLDAEADKIEEDGAAIARIVVAFLRFFSPPAVHFPAGSGNALLGSELVPMSNLLVIGDGTFSYKQAMLVPNAPGWRISEETLKQIRPGLDAVGALVRPEGLSEFALAVRSSLLLFSTGTTFASPIERLSYTLSAIEALLLRHSAEPAEFNVADRMGLLLTRDGKKREEVARNIREAYRLRGRQDVSPLFPREMGSVATFVRRAHHVIGTALGNFVTFGTVSEFINAVEDLRNQSASTS